MATITSTGTGNWADGPTWVGGSAPATTDDAVIAATHTVTVAAAAQIVNVTTNATGILAFSGGAKLSVGTALAAGAITNDGTIRLVGGEIAPVSGAFPWTLSGTAIDVDSGVGTATLNGGTHTPALTTGASNAVTIVSRSITWVGAITISSGDTWKSISSTYQGAITATGTFASCNHNLLNHYVYGKAGQIKLSTLNDAQYCPKNGSAIYVLNGELYVDRGPFNETLAPTTAPVYRYILSDAAHHANANLSFADGIQVRLPKGWSRFGTGVLGGSRKNVAFRCVFQYGFEGETAGANPALGTTTEGAGGGAVDVSASNPDTGLNSLDFNEPAAASGATTWKSPAFQVEAIRALVKLSVFTDSTMAGASIIEEIQIRALDSGNADTIDENVLLAFKYISAGLYKIQLYNGSAFVDLTTATVYAASTRYELHVMIDTNADDFLLAVNGVIEERAGAFWHTDTTGVSRIWFQSNAANDGRIFLDNLIVCNLDVDTVAKSLSGGWADLDDASLATPSETPAANLRIPVIDLPAGVVY